MTAADPELEEGWVATELAEEFPELRLRWLIADAARARSPEELRERLAMLSSRFHGAEAVVMRQSPIPQAYRVFFRTIGLDPDATRTPIEAAALNRLIEGGFKSVGLIEDALLLALVETGVPVWALDDAQVDGPLGLRTAVARELLGRGEYANELPAGRLVVADAAGPVAVLFGALSPAHVVTARTRRLRIFTVQVAGVPEIHVEEALWSCVEALRAAR